METPLLFAIQALAENSMVKQTNTPRSEGSASVFEKPRELLANTVWRFLHDRGYINPVSHLSEARPLARDQSQEARASPSEQEAFRGRGCSVDLSANVRYSEDSN